ncbi:N-(5'-phosphoribosyl)anthranilate isomerase [Candidatus Methanoplasma termitum]|uniref:N-(5'-phosphoribosyl)anthranilate isomerase n=1 Tax=Candidatus Methanoplasma termitum TaxID=1577791 RepID=A0A0A7LAA8_9ARCH|nr:phosphoribosylanthranilate isomerase [Candidatus Methanoplasma termitum]AIZ55958.1 N-(5'-phosphoribosyl)anthranilate isomerase [Candidatus Methanoplasma termitum]MCL2334430.1 phosphoribosylanthranilate isomerase [Candidatus Methanoplasma sp.]
MSKVKICGLSRPEDIEAANSVLPDYIGFVFAESRRQIDEKKAKSLKGKLDGRIEAVGVFVNEDAEKVSKLYKNGTIDMVQLHGDEDSEYIKQLKEDCGCRVIKSIPIGGSIPPIPKGSDYLLFDNLSAQRGGSGKTFDWHILKGFDTMPYFLAGGLNSSNVWEAVRTLSPYCMDVSGGVETGGVKDPAKIKEFVKLVREAD